MAIGEQIDEGLYSGGGGFKSSKLLDNQGADTTGKWIDVRNFKNHSIEISGTFDASVEVRVSNAPDPLDSDNGTLVGNPITAAEIVVIDMGVRFIKCLVDNYVSGSVSANLHSIK